METAVAHTPQLESYAEFLAKIQDVTNIRGEVTEIRGEVSDIRERVARIEENQNSKKEQLTRVEVMVKDIGDNVVALSERSTRVELKQESIDKVHTAAQAKSDNRIAILKNIGLAVGGAAVSFIGNFIVQLFSSHPAAVEAAKKAFEATAAK